MASLENGLIIIKRSDVNLNHSIIMEQIEQIERPVDFDGVFRFTNCSDEDFKALWNNKEYTFPAKSTCPMIIEGETLENIQEIRKRFAKRYAEREYFKTKGYLKMRNGVDGAVPSQYNPAELQKYIDQCLEPLPVAPVKVIKKKGDETTYRATKGVGKKDNLNEMFKDSDIPELGEMAG